MKSHPEVTRKWGEKLDMSKEIAELIERRWKEYGIE